MRRRHGVRHRACNMAAAACLITLLGGCGTGAATDTQRASTATPSPSVLSGPRTVGEFDALTLPAIAAAGTVHLHAATDNPNAQSGGRTTLDADARTSGPVNLRMAIDGPPGHADIVVLAGTVYIRQSPMRRWVRGSLGTITSATDPGVWRLPGLNGTTRGLAAAYGGTHPIEQIADRRYALHLTTAERLAALPDGLRAQLRGSAEEGSGPTIVQLTLDDRDRPVKEIIDGPTGTVQIDYSRWGAPVDITAPAT